MMHWGVGVGVEKRRRCMRHGSDPEGAHHWGRKRALTLSHASSWPWAISLSCLYFLICTMGIIIPPNTRDFTKSFFVIQNLHIFEGYCLVSCDIFVDPKATGKVMANPGEVLQEEKHKWQAGGQERDERSSYHAMSSDFQVTSVGSPSSPLLGGWWPR